MGLYEVKGTPLCAIKTASGTLMVTMYAGRTLMGFLGRSNLTVSETPVKFAKASPVLWRVAVPEIGSGVVKAWRAAKAGKPVDEFLKGMEKNRGVKVKVLEEQPDENVENAPKEVRSSKNLPGDVESYRDDIQRIADVVGETKGLSESLMRMRLPDSMWGIKEVKKLIAGVKNEMDGLKAMFDKFDIAMESTDKKAGMTASLMRHAGMAKKEIAAGAVSGMISDFFTAKALVSGMAQVLYPLFSIDGMFKKATGYPTTWAFDPSTFYDFQFCYDGLVKGLVRLAKSESSIIEPLSVWKVQTVNYPRLKSWACNVSQGYCQARRAPQEQTGD